MYLTKHNKRVHPDVSTSKSNKVFPTGKCEQKEMSTTSNYKEPETPFKRSSNKYDVVTGLENSHNEDSDWDHDPDIEIKEAEETENINNDSKIPDSVANSINENREKEENLNEDERTVNDIRTGRIFRKRTNPSPVFAPKSKKVAKDEKEEKEVMKHNTVGVELPETNKAELSDNEEFFEKVLLSNYKESQEADKDKTVKVEDKAEMKPSTSKINDQGVIAEDNYKLEREKLELERRKLDLEIAKFEYKKNVLNKITDLVSNI